MTSLSLPRRYVALAATVLLAVLALVGVMSARSAASADPYPPSSGCTVSTASGSYAPGKTATLTGSGYPADSSLTVSGSSNSGKGKTIGHANTDSAGGFRVAVHMPSSWQVNKVTVSASSVTCSLNNLDTDSANRHRSTDGGNASRGASNGVGAEHAHRGTASTGFQTLTASLIAVVLLGGGLVLVYAGRRRRS